MRKYKKAIANAIFLILCVALTLYYVLRGEDFGALVEYLKSSSQIFWLAAFLLVIAFILCESIIIFYLMHSFGEKPKLSHCCLYSFVGFFFSLVTPTGSGGQPMQLVFMNKDGLSLSVSTIVLLTITVTYKSVLILVGIVVVALRACGRAVALVPAMPWIWLGIFLNVVCVGFMMALILDPVLVKKLVFRCFALVKKVVHSDKIDVWEQKAEGAMQKYEMASSYVKSHKSVMAVVMAITIMQRCFLFAVTCLVFISFGINQIGYGDTLVFQGSISLAADMLPLPGGIGISEHLFQVIFEPIVGSALTVPTLMVSRGLSFYAQLFCCAIMTIVAYLVIFGVKREK